MARQVAIRRQQALDQQQYGADYPLPMSHNGLCVPGMEAGSPQAQYQLGMGNQ